MILDLTVDHRDLDQMKMTATEGMSLPETASSCQYLVAIDTLHDSASPGYVLSLVAFDTLHDTASPGYVLSLAAIDTLHDAVSPGYVLSLVAIDTLHDTASPH